MYTKKVKPIWCPNGIITIGIDRLYHDHPMFIIQKDRKMIENFQVGILSHILLSFVDHFALWLFKFNVNMYFSYNFFSFFLFLCRYSSPSARYFFHLFLHFCLLQLFLLLFFWIFSCWKFLVNIWKYPQHKHTADHLDARFACICI